MTGGTVSLDSSSLYGAFATGAPVHATAAAASGSAGASAAGKAAAASAASASAAAGAYGTAEAAATAEARESVFADALITASAGGKYDLDAIFEAASRKYGISADLLKAVAKAESNFRPDATSKCGAMGIMQLMPGTAKMLGVTDAYDPEQNIMGGADFLKQMLDKFGGDVRLALAAYNAGPGNVVKYGGVPPFSETQNYVKTVTGYLGDGAISAGSVYYRGLSSGRYLSEKGADSAGLSSFAGNLSQMMLMKIIEMQMNSSSDDDKKNKVF